ncbi:PDZ and LIM domain protein 2 [Ambystoma mexicanum]|uniref:PDZ and LIM domain protein 2 n=1 Tax=Ambystoma mexicanum TaxID=8296 RepID=UPI0037E6FBD2
MAVTMTVTLTGASPWGFRITGGRDYHTPITVSQVTGRSKAAAADLRPGDIIRSINGDSTDEMLNVEAQNKIKKSPSDLRLGVDRPDVLILTTTDGCASPSFLASRFQDSVKIVKDESVYSTEDSYSSAGSLSPRSGSPFSPPSPQPAHRRNGFGDRHRDTLVADQCAEVVVSRRSLQSQSSPPGATEYKPEQASYSRGNGSPVPPVYRAQSPLHPGAPPAHSPPEIVRSYSPQKSVDLDSRMNRFEEDSEVYKMIQENQETRAPPRQSSSFRMLQAALDTESDAVPHLPSRLSPNAQNPVRSSVAAVQNLRTCEKCGTGIMNQAVRIQEDQYRHPACYVCSDCGLNLKMRGHFWAGDRMYCEKHARERHQAAAAKSSPALHS